MPDEANIEIGDATEYVSYSAFTSWLRCGKAYQLFRIVKVEEKPAWYFAGGSAFHLAAENYDRSRWENGVA